MKHSTLSLISITMLLIHGIVYAQQAVNSAQLTTHQQQLLVKQAIFDANVDVRQQVSGMNWFLAGVFCQVWALGYVVLDTPQVSPKRLLGKSPDYITAYTAEYQRKAKNKRIQRTCLGLVTLYSLVGLIVMSDDFTIFNFGSY